jgi:hypothetical protein
MEKGIVYKNIKIKKILTHLNFANFFSDYVEFLRIRNFRLPLFFLYIIWKSYFLQIASVLKRP